MKFKKAVVSTNGESMETRIAFVVDDNGVERVVDDIPVETFEFKLVAPKSGKVTLVLHVNDVDINWRAR